MFRQPLCSLGLMPAWSFSSSLSLDTGNSTLASFVAHCTSEGPCAWRRQGRGEGKGTRISSGRFLGFELVLPCKSFWQYHLESVPCSQASGCGSLGFMTESLLLRAGWLYVLSRCVSWPGGTNHPLSLPKPVLALLDMLK